MFDERVTQVGRRAPEHQAPDSHLGFLLWRANRLFLDELRRELAQRGYDDLSATHVNIMPMLDVDGTSAQVLAKRIGITKQAAGKVVAELERTGYVSRVPDPGDARARFVVFTAKGRALLDEGEIAKLAIEARWLADLDAGAVVNLKEALSTITSPYLPPK